MDKVKRERITIDIDPIKRKRFQKIAKFNNSDASKLIRTWVDKYLAENSQLEF